MNFAHPSAIVHKSAKIGPLVSILEKARIRPNVVIGAGTVIGENVEVGEGTVLGSGVHLSNCRIGRDCIIHQGVCIGQDGFGFHLDTIGGKHEKKPQTRSVLIGSNVEIGANSTVDRGSWRNTVIESGCKLDNLVQIGHNARLRKGCVIAAQSGVAGSTTLGQRVIIGGQVGIAQHITLGDEVQVLGKSAVLRSVASGTVGGRPALPVRDYHKTKALIKKMLTSRKDPRPERKPVS
mmetsp:Transcript_7902/g.11700  ORF Transcript_7902/g.11700 Transcript_7902/m.11700 type:complete len:236 (-) Transcript_7902:2572-3279(-)